MAVKFTGRKLFIIIYVYKLFIIINIHTLSQDTQNPSRFFNLTVHVKAYKALKM